MANYASQTDIEAEFKGVTFGASTAVTPTQLTEWLTQATNYINAKISQRYQTPVDSGTSPIGHSILKMICTFLVAERVKNKLEVKTPVNQKDSEEKFIPNQIATPKKDLEAIVKGDLPLPDVPLRGGKLGISSFTADFDTCCRTFDTCEDRW